MMVVWWLRLLCWLGINYRYIGVDVSKDGDYSVEIIRTRDGVLHVVSEKWEKRI